MGFVATIPFWALCIIVGLYFLKRKPNNNLRATAVRAICLKKRKRYVAKLKEIRRSSISIYRDIILPNFFLISTFRVVGYASFFLLWLFLYCCLSL